MWSVRIELNQVSSHHHDGPLLSDHLLLVIVPHADRPSLNSHKLLLLRRPHEDPLRLDPTAKVLPGDQTNQPKMNLVLLVEFLDHHLIHLRDGRREL